MNYKTLFKITILGTALAGSALNAQSQMIDIASMAPSDAFLPLITLGVDTTLPLALGVLTDSPLSGPLFTGFEQFQPVAATLIDQENLKALSNLYAPLEEVVVPLSEGM